MSVKLCSLLTLPLLAFTLICCTGQSVYTHRHAHMPSSTATEWRHAATVADKPWSAGKCRGAAVCLHGTIRHSTTVCGEPGFGPLPCQAASHSHFIASVKIIGVAFRRAVTLSSAGGPRYPVLCTARCRAAWPLFLIRIAPAYLHTRH